MTKKYSISHLRFAAIFTAALYAANNALLLDRLAPWFPGADGTDALALAAYLAIGLLLFFAIFLLMAHPRVVKPLAGLLILLSATATYFISKYDVAVDTTMALNFFHTDPVEVKGFLSTAMLPFVAFLVLLPLWLLTRVEVRFARPPRYLLSSAAGFLGALLLAVALLYSQYDAIHRAVNVSRKGVVHRLVPINIIRSLGALAQEPILDVLRSLERPVEIDARLAERRDLVVVLAIGESSRKKNFALYGYRGNPTNPHLMNVEGLHLLTGRAGIGSTIYALEEILDRMGVKLPALTQRAGVPTACYVNFTLYDNCEVPGEVEVHDCGHGGTCYDEDVLPLLAADLESYDGGPRFIALHLGGGSHGPNYHNRYPPEFQKFNPQCRDADVLNRCTPRQLYNSYDNTILYVDFVLSRLIATLDAAEVPYVFIYVSDHGESLLEGGRLFHGMPPGIDLPPEQAEVPLIVKASVPIDVAQVETVPHQDVYDTVVGLLGIETKLLRPDRVFLRLAPSETLATLTAVDPESRRMPSTAAPR